MISIAASPEGVSFWIHVTPRARKERIGGTQGDALRVSVSAPPVGGAANAACLAALAKVLGVRRRAVDLDPGARGRRKRVRVAGDAQALARRLRELAEAEAPR